MGLWPLFHAQFRPVLALLVLLATAPIPQPRQALGCAATTLLDRAAQARLEQALRQLPLYFVENQGQIDERVAYYLQGSATAVYFTADGVTFVLTGLTSQPPSLQGRGSGSPPRVVEGLGERSLQRWVVKLEFLGANPDVRPTGQERSEAVIAHFKGSPDQWHIGLPTYARLVYPDLWPGIDLVYHGTVNRLKYEFLVHPGADPAQIRLAYRGATSVTLNAAGQLAVSTPLGSLTDDTPAAWQEVDGQRIPVSVAYALDGNCLAPDLANPQSAITNRQSFAFRLGAYDSTLPLALDPAVLVYCGYIGGSGWDEGQGIAVDEAGNAYVTGWTTSSEASFPTNVGPDLTFNGDSDIFVAKVKADGTGLVYCGYIGGVGDEVGHDVAVDEAGNAYITGLTTSTEATFPVLVGPDLTYNGGDYDAFVAKVKADGTGLIYCGYLGGASTDWGSAIAVDGAGHAYVTGWTYSSEASFPMTVGPDLTYNGDRDGFVAKVRADGTGLVYCGYLGGAAYDEGQGIAVDAAGNAYVTGSTTSSEASFPVAVGPDLTFNGGSDAFVAQVKADGTGLVYCGYIGGSGYDYGLAVDGAGNAYVTGYTSSNAATFPVTVGPELTYNGGDDAFVAKVKADGTGLIYCGYIGGAGDDIGHVIAVDAEGNAYITGWTTSTETTFPVAVGPDLTYNGDIDTFVAKVQADGTGLAYCGYLGGSGYDLGYGIAVDGAGNAYVAGWTASPEATFPVTGGPGLTFNGDYDTFVAKIAYSSLTLLPLFKVYSGGW